MPVAMEVKITTKEGKDLVEKLRVIFLYPGSDNTAKGLKMDVEKFAKEMRKKYGYAGV